MPSVIPLQLLLVDDDEVDRLTVRRYLKQSGLSAEVTEAVDATKALELLRSRPFDCGIFDYQMPGRDGLWLLTSARAAGITVPVVMLTGQGDERTAVESMKAGASDYLPKDSLSPARLAQSLKQVRRVHLAEAESKRAAQSLDDERVRFQMALAATSLGIWDFDTAARSLHWDPRCRQLLELPESVGPDVSAIVDALHFEDRERVIEAARLTFSSPETGLFETEFRIGGRPGSAPVWLRATGRAFFEAGQPTRLIGTLQDVSARKQQEVLDRKSEEFQRQLIGIVSHDLRNPISAMIMSAELLIKRGDLDARTNKGLARIVNSGERAKRMIRDLLDFTQASVGGGIPIHPRSADLNEVARHVVDEVQQTHPDRKLFFEAVGDGRGEWDSDRIAQVATNLAVNAVSYSPEGSPVYVRTWTEANVAILEVRNGGAPIPGEVLPTLFEPFRRGTDPANAVGGNVGLGLFIVDQLVRAHGGSVKVSSTEALGTTFTVSLPRTQPARQVSVP